MLHFLVGILALAGSAQASPASVPLPAPAPVVDEARLLSGAEDAQLDQLLRKIKSERGVEISVFIASSLRGLSIEDLSLEAAMQWNLGRKKEDKGLLITIAPADRKMRIEVGYGLEGEITDAFARRALDEGMRPQFRQGKYYAGIMSALAMIQTKVPLGIQSNDVPSQDDESMGIGLKFFIFLLIVLYFISFLMRVRRYGYYGGYYGGGWGGGLGGGGLGGGSWGGGGGSFGGGGSSSSW